MSGEDKKKKTPSAAEELKTVARGMCGKALDTLAAIMDGQGTDSAKLAAAREVLDRAHGKPKSAAKPRARKPKDPTKGPMTVIVKRFSEVTPEDEAEHDATEALYR